jgi:tetratricopeptide (TPR) repeat protein/tRNA A-37 threonylcarbamoyl transferase component Bud32
MPSDSPLTELLLRWEELREQGKDATAEELCIDSPENLEEVRRRIAAFQAMDRLMAMTSDEAATRSLASTVPPAGLDTKDFVTPTPGKQSIGPTGRYSVVRSHARGGLGEVFVALDTELNRQIALKRIQERHAGSADSRRRFLVEAEITAHLEHPGIVPVYGLVTDEHGQPSYAMRFIEGESLHDAIQNFHREWDQPTHGRSERFQSLEFRQLLQRFTSVCNTIAFAHSRGVIHRDIKPANVMLGKYGETLLVDWGLAKQIASHHASEEAKPTIPSASDSCEGVTQIGQAIGTPVFMSPEQAAGRWDLVGPAADIYSIGATLYVLLTGRQPFTDSNPAALLANVRDGRIPPPRSMKRGVPAALEAVCLKAMAGEPTGRYSSALDLASDVERWLADDSVRAYREPWSVRAWRWARKHKTLVVTGLVAGLLIVLAAGLAFYLKHLADQRQARLIHDHRESVRSTAEAQEQMGLNELRANRLSSGVELFRQSVQLLWGEPELQALYERLNARLGRAERLARYRQLNNEIEESIYADAEVRTLKALEGALAEFRALQNPHWWESLPDEDLTPQQKQLLRVDVHTKLLLLGGVRARQGLMSIGNQVKAREGYEKGLEALAAAQRFEKTHSATFMELYCKVGLGQDGADALQQTNIQPTSYADFLLIGIMHQWLGKEFDDTISRFVISRIRSPIIDLKTPLVTSEKLLRRAISIYPDYPWTYMMLSWTLDLAKKPEDSELALRAFLAIDPESTTARCYLAHAILAQRREGDSLERKKALEALALREIQPLQKQRNPTWRSDSLLAGVLEELGKTDDAITALRQSLKLVPEDDPEQDGVEAIHHMLGRLLLARKEYRPAIASLTEAIRLDAKSKKGLYGTSLPTGYYQRRAQAYLAVGDVKAAHADVSMSVKLEPASDVYAFKAQIHWYTRDYQQAIADATKGIARNAKDSWPYEVRGQVHATLGDWERAANDFQKAVELEPVNLKYRFWLALTLVRKGDQAGYRRLCADALARFSGSDQSGFADDVALICFFAAGGVGDARPVVTNLEKVLAQSKENAAMLYLGAGHLRAGSLDKAHELLSKAYPAVPKGERTWMIGCLLRGLCAQRRDEPQEAQRWFSLAESWYEAYLDELSTANAPPMSANAALLNWQDRILVEVLLPEAGRPVPRARSRLP